MTFNNLHFGNTYEKRETPFSIMINDKEYTGKYIQKSHGILCTGKDIALRYSLSIEWDIVPNISDSDLDDLIQYLSDLI